MNTRSILPAVTLASLLPLAATAMDLVPDGAFVEGGFAARGAYSGTVGVQWRWDWSGHFGNTAASGITELYLSRWSAHGLTQREQVTQLGLLPLVRLRLDQGRSPWFMEGGIGLTMMDHLYVTGSKQFSTRFNFVDVFGFGRSVGADRRQEVSLRIAHISNAQIKQPNPGENFIQLRYGVMF
jgi:lipid A 3-O-deacylase